MNQIVIKRNIDYRTWVCAALLFVISFPKWFWGMGSFVIVIASLLLLATAYNDISRNKRTRGLGIFAILAQFYILWITYITETTNIVGYVVMLLQGIGFFTIFLCSGAFLKKCVDCFIKILAVLLIFALAEHILISFIEVEPISPVFAECPLNPDRDYQVYIFNVYLDKAFDFFNRFYAFYDEPGVLGNIMMALLYTQKFDLRKWHNIVLLVSGIMSFSLAFYIGMASYYIIFGNNRQRTVFIVAVLLGVYYFYNNEYIYDYVFGRLEFVNGQMAGYNREMHGDFETWIKTVPVTDYFFWGYQPSTQVPYAASWRWAFAHWGIIPSLFYLFALIYPRTKYIPHKNDILLGLVLTVIIWIQRPFVYLYIYVFLIVIPFIYYSTNESKKGLAVK